MALAVSCSANVRPCKPLVVSGARVSVKHAARGCRRVAHVCQAASTDKQMRDAEARWESQVREGRVRNISSEDAGKMMKEGWILLDVRPPTEVKKVPVRGAVTVPLFVPDARVDPGSLLKQMSAFGMGGWWLGGTHMEPNANFLAEVQSKVPKDAQVIVACQKGLRSLAACEQLSRAGYTTLAWINGGFDTAKKTDLPVEEGKDIRYAGIGGLSEVLGWTEVQQADAREKGFLGGFENVIRFAAVIVVLDALVFAYEQIRYMASQAGQ